MHDEHTPEWLWKKLLKHGPSNDLVATSTHHESSITPLRYFKIDWKIDTTKSNHNIHYGHAYTVLGAWQFEVEDTGVISGALSWLDQNILQNEKKKNLKTIRLVKIRNPHGT